MLGFGGDIGVARNAEGVELQLRVLEVEDLDGSTVQLQYPQLLRLV